MNALQQGLTDYLATRRALGTQLGWPEGALRHFVEFLEAHGAPFITLDLAVRWAVAPIGVMPSTHARRLDIVRGFAVWLQATDPRTEVPPKRLLPTGTRRPIPHIYTDQEIADLMSAAHRLRSRTGLRSWTYATLIGLLAATGLRPGEALRLDLADVDLLNGILAVRESKFGKSRFVPLEASSLAALTAYAEHRDQTCPRRPTAAFLVTEGGSRLEAYTTRRTFAALGRTVGLRPSGLGRRSGRGPRLQDLRHTFATRRLIEWYRAGGDIERLMPNLSTYLGHVCVEVTYWYIQAVPELLELATERLEHNRQEERR